MEQIQELIRRSGRMQGEKLRVELVDSTLATETTLLLIKTALQLIDDIIATTGSAIPTKGAAVSGTDGTNARVLKTDASGELQIDVLSSALPTGASTSALQTTIDTSINTLLKPASTLTKVTTVDTITNSVTVTNTNLDVALSTVKGEIPRKTQQNDWASSTVLYSGWAVYGSSVASAVWSIRKRTFDANGGYSDAWADGNATADNIWNNRASLSYS